MSSSVKDTDKGWSEIVRQMKNLKGSSVVVGILESAGEHKSKEKSSSGVTNAAVGTWMEFGVPSKNIPSRPFLSLSYDTSIPKIKIFKQKLLQQIVDRKITVDKALGLLGLFFQRIVQENIGKSSLWAPNKPQTIKRKRDSTKPLIDTGQLRASINFEVRRG